MIEFYIKPRKSGKTTLLVKLFENVNNAYYVIEDNEKKKHIIGLSDELNETNVLTVREFINKYKSKSNSIDCDVLFIDDYLLMFDYHKKILNDIVFTKNIEKVYIATSVDKKYNNNLIEYVRKCRSKFHPIELDTLRTICPDFTIEEIMSYVDNIITQPDVTIREDEWYKTNAKYNEYLDELRNMVPKDIFEAEYLNRWKL